MINPPRPERCCMCPQTKTACPVCPGIQGTPHPKDSACDFVVQYLDNEGRLVFAGRLLGDSYAAVFETQTGGRHRVKSPALPLRSTFDAAQADLNAYATKKDWRRAS